MRLILASASPRRADLLRAAGIEFDVHPAHVDERVLPDEAADAYVRRVSEAKAEVIGQRFPRAIVLAADTTVVADRHILGKPIDVEDARRMLHLLSGRAHEVLTAVTVRGPDTPLDIRTDSTTVEFARLTDEEIDWYVSSGEPMDKAGGYAIQGLASRFVTRIAGSYSNVVGLPVAMLHDMLKPYASL